MFCEAAFVAVFGGIICLDRMVLQAMFSRPVVAGPLIGWMLGDPYTGLIGGAFVELLWIDRLPFGAYVPPNDTFVVVLVTAGSVLAGREIGHVSKELIALSILLFVPFGVLGQQLESWIRRSNDRLSQGAVEDAKTGNMRGIASKHWTGLAKMFVLSIFFILIALIPGVLFLENIFPLIPEKMISALTYSYFFIPLLGVGVALNTIKLRGMIPVFSGIFLVIALVMELL
jgi:mannose PTS system EIIC component